jgi:hypothetical protein
MTIPTKAVLLIVLGLWFAGCSGSDGTTDIDGSVATDGAVGQDGGGSGVLPFPHGECTSTGGDGFPAFIGQGCAAGSNKSLCLMTGGSSCTPGLCLWDTADPTGQKAYCTIECNPQDAQPCPDSFTCKPDECDGRNICVRTSTPKPPTLPYTITKDVVSLQEGLTGVAALQDGTSYWYTQSGTVFARSPQGQWSNLGTFGSQTLKANGVAVAGGVGYAYGGEFYGKGWLVKLGGGTPEKKDLDNNVVGAFSDPSGNLVVLLEGWDNAGLHKVGKDLSLTPLQSGLEATLSKVTPLQSHGFIAVCELKDKSRKLCIGTDGTDTATIETPADLLEEPGVFTAGVMFAGLKTDDIWGLTNASDASNYKRSLMHYDGTKWVKETLAPFDPGIIHPVTDRVAVVFDRDRLMQFNGKCWKSLLPEGEDPGGEYEGRYPFTLANDRVGWMSYLDFIELKLDVN